MRKPLSRTSLLTAALAVAVVALVSCADGDIVGHGEKQSRGFDYLPDMYESPAYRSQQAQVPASKPGDPVHQVPAMMTLPDGTVPRDFLPYQIAPLDFVSPKQLLNPLSPTAQVLKDGQTSFNIYCAVCHGRDGDAKNGYVAAYFPAILSLNGPNLGLLADGDIYHIITSGRNNMPNYRAQLLPEQRWKVILYLRALNHATLATSDAAGALKAAEAAAAKAKPEDAEFAKKLVEAAQKTLDQSKRDLELIKSSGKGDEFAPAQSAVPEYLKSQWPENTP